MLDANASGALGALWIPIAIGFAATARTKGAAAAMALAAAVLTLSVWATGSRTALLAAVAGAASLPHLAARSPGSRRPLLIAAAAMLALIAGTAVVARSSTVGPIARVRAEFAPLVNSGGAVRALEELWSRNGYGTASVRMFQDSPLTGVGVGAFPALVHEATGLPADYAQNWIRHQLVELGVVGSLGLLLWMAVLAVTFPRQPQDPRFSVRLLTMKYAIAGVGLASMLGVPGQNLFVALTVWTLLFAVLTLTGFEAVKTIDHGRRGLAPAAALVWAVVFAAATVYTGLTELRPPVRAKRLGYPYQYGFIDRVDGPNGATRSLAQGLAVPLAATGTVKLTFWVEHPDADTRPVFVDVRLDGRRIVHGQFSRGTPLIQVERVPAGQRYILETEVDRTFMPPDTPGREGGVNVRWEYLEDAKRP
jgi:hypothetical protein